MFWPHTLQKHRPNHQQVVDKMKTNARTEKKKQTETKTRKEMRSKVLCREIVVIVVNIKGYENQLSYL